MVGNALHPEIILDCPELTQEQRECDLSPGHPMLPSQAKSGDRVQHIISPSGFKRELDRHAWNSVSLFQNLRSCALKVREAWP